MKLRHLEIKNFRGITNLDLKLGDITVLIGENNTGKTAILDALKFALRSVRTRRSSSFDAYDFHLRSLFERMSRENGATVKEPS